MSANSEPKASETSNPEISNQEHHINKESNNQPKLQIKNFFSSWKFKLSIILISVFVTILIIVFREHLIAVQGMKGWASHASAQPIDCMLQDTNGDKYISCTAKLNEQIVPLECGTSFLNIGCRVNYGNASPNIRSQQEQWLYSNQTKN